MRAWDELFAVEPDGTGGIRDSEVELRSRRSRTWYENPARIETSAQRCAWVRQTGLGDRVVARGSGKLKGNDISFGGSDVGRVELEDTAGFARCAADLYDGLSPGEKR